MQRGARGMPALFRRLRCLVRGLKPREKPSAGLKPPKPVGIQRRRYPAPNPVPSHGSTIGITTDNPPDAARLTIYHYLRMRTGTLELQMWKMPGIDTGVARVV
jgi:hypothetical protein